MRILSGRVNESACARVNVARTGTIRPVTTAFPSGPKPGGRPPHSRPDQRQALVPLNTLTLAEKYHTMTRTTTILAALLTLGTALPATAGAPDTPGEKGRIVNRDKAHWQNQPGAGKNAWGETVSGVATSQEGGNNETSLGNFLSAVTAGPNASGDNGKGND